MKPKHHCDESVQRRAEEVFRRLSRANPNPKCELFFTTPYQLLLSVVLSAQTTDKMVNRCMEPLYKEGLNPTTVLTLGEAGFLAKIKSIGLAPTKAKRVIQLTKILLEEHDGQVPHTREALESLPGVGRKTASVILAELYGEPVLAVDTHVFRVAGRLGLHQEKTPEHCERKLYRVIDPKYLPAAHHWLILHGRYVCTARRPRCSECGLRNLCPSNPSGPTGLTTENDRQ